MTHTAENDATADWGFCDRPGCNRKVPRPASDGGYLCPRHVIPLACEYAGPGRTRCPSWRCDCFIETHPDSPRDLHPEAFTVGRVIPPGVSSR